MDLSRRLQAVSSLVTAGSRVADIGTDHAYIPIYLIQKQLVPSAIAMDVNAGPLMRAKEHVRANGLEEKIELRLSDGFRELKPFEADTAVIAGMGGGLVVKILTDCRDVTCSLKECILQPQSEIAKVRTFLLEEGFLFIEEDMVLDDEKYYPMMKVIPPSAMSGCSLKQEAAVSYAADNRRQNGRDTSAGWNETELRYGKLLLEQRHPVLHQYLEREKRIYGQILESLKKQSGERIEQRRAELNEELEYVQRGLKYYEVQ